MCKPEKILLVEHTVLALVEHIQFALQPPRSCCSNIKRIKWYLCNVLWAMSRCSNVTLKRGCMTQKVNIIKQNAKMNIIGFNKPQNSGTLRLYLSVPVLTIYHLHFSKNGKWLRNKFTFQLSRMQFGIRVQIQQ